MPLFSEADKQAIKGVVQEIENSMTRVDGENDFVKEACKEAKEKYGVEPKHLKKLATTLHKQNLADQEEEFELFVESYEQLFGGNK